MAITSGVQQNAIAQVASTWGTAVAAGPDDKFICRISDSGNENVLRASQIGSGNFMATDSTRGSIAPTVTTVGQPGFRSYLDIVLGSLLGTSAVSAEITGGQGDYRHTYTMNVTTVPPKIVTIAREDSSGTVIEYPTCACRSMTLSTTDVPGYLECTAEWIANTIELSTVVNTNAIIAAATLLDTELVSAFFDDDFQLNTQAGGAVSTSDQVDITSWSLTLERPMRTENEIRNGTGASAPVMDGQITGSLTVTLKGLVDHTWHNYWNNETALKSKLILSGTQIGSGSVKSVTVYLPRMKLITKPEHQLEDEGVNPVSLTFELMKAASAPTGMSGSTYPYVEIINTKSTSII